MPAQQLTITLSNETIQALQGMGYALYAMRGFNTTNAAGKPLVWLTTTQFANAISIDFAIQYAAYMSTTTVVGGVVIVQSTSAPVELGQTATLGADSRITVTTAGRSDAVTLVNGTTSPFTTGLAAAHDAGQPAPVFAEPLYGLGEDIAAPLDQFLLTFTTQGTTVGTVIEHAMSQSLLVDMGGQAAVTASFDINTGWDAAGAPWAKSVAAGAALVPLLSHETPMG
jgi:hypothetical protein